MRGRRATTTDGPPASGRPLGPLAAARAALAIVDPGVRRRFYAGLVPGVALGVLEAAGVALVLPLVLVLGARDQGSGGALGGRLVRLVSLGHASPPLWIAVAALGALILRTAASAALVAWQLRVVAGSERELTRRLLRVYLTQPWSFHQQRDLAELTGNVRLHVWQIHAQMVTPAFTLPGELAVVVSVAVVLVALNPLAAAAVALVFGAVVLGAVRFGGRRAAEAGADVQRSAVELQQRVHDGLRAAKSLSVHGGGDVLAARMEDALAAGERARYHMALAQYLPRYLLEATMAAGVGGLALALRASSSADPVASLDLRIRAGSFVAVTGPSASGKTTLLDLVLGLRRPTSGTVLVDGGRLDEATTPSWLGRAGYVPQDALVLDDTVRRNVALGVADKDVDDVAAAAPCGTSSSATWATTSTWSSATGTGGSRAGSASGWPSPGPSTETPTSSSWTSRPRRSTRPPRPGWSAPCGCSPDGGPSSWSPTGRRRRRAATASSPSTTAGWWRTTRAIGGASAPVVDPHHRQSSCPAR